MKLIALIKRAGTKAERVMHFVLCDCAHCRTAHRDSAFLLSVLQPHEPYVLALLTSASGSLPDSVRSWACEGDENNT